MDAVMLSRCARLGWERHGMSWTRLAFEKKYEIIRELEAAMPPTAKPRVTIPERRADGQSEGIGGGTGKLLDEKLVPKTPELAGAAGELTRAAFHEAEGGEYGMPRPGVGAARFDHPNR